MPNILKSLTQKSVWFLILPALVVLAILDMPLVKTLLEWSLFALVLAGIAIVISMVTLPQINLTKFVEKAEDGDVAAGIVVGSVVLFVGVLFYTLTYWAKT